MYGSRSRLKLLHFMKLHSALNALRERKQRLIDAFVYQQAIDRATYQEQLHKLHEELAFAEIDERDAWTRWICGLPLISRVRLAKCAAPVDRISVRAEAAIATSPFSTGRANRGWQLSNR